MSNALATRRWLPAPKPVLVGLAVWLGFAAGAWLASDVTPKLPVLFGFVAGVYAWAHVAYPAPRRQHTRTLDGRDRWLAAAVALVVASQLMLVDAPGLRAARWILTFLTTLGSILTAVRLGTLIGERGGDLEETDLP